ncbi:hypothetical protein F5Y13DRAFT_187107 [Hypoxylon sp. FL1857]|nr:hypothetical protein F5Y13DRAFT_187107 [Hypoxylon sp. FL1857]
MKAAYLCPYVPSAVALPWGCTIELDALGLPATSLIQHGATGCSCIGYQEAILLSHLKGWQDDGEHLLQIEPKCVAAIIVKLIDKWGLGTSSFQEYVHAWKEELWKCVTIPTQPSPRIGHKKKKQGITKMGSSYRFRRGIRHGTKV